MSNKELQLNSSEVRSVEKASSEKMSLLSYSNAFFGPFFGLWATKYFYPLFEDVKYPILLKIGMLLPITLLCTGNIIGIYEARDITTVTTKAERFKKMKINHFSLIFFVCLMFISMTLMPNYRISSFFGLIFFIWWSAVTVSIIVFI